MFADRVDAGRQLAEPLRRFAGPGTVVVGLPRGGVVVAAEVASALGAPLDVILVRKLGVPFEPEWAMGAIGEDDVRVVDQRVLAMAGVEPDDVARVEERERAELRRRTERYRAGRPRIPLAGKVVLVVDDGIATGSTARAACQVARVEGAARVVLAVPVAPPDWEERLAGEADEFVTVATPASFFAIGQFYDDFGQTSDDEVLACLSGTAEPER
jgi:putative phosphoribosyl transferase